MTLVASPPSPRVGAEHAPPLPWRATVSGRDIIPRAERHPPGLLPAEGTLGRLGRARLSGVAGAGGAPFHACADDLLQLRVGLRSARLRRSRDARGAQVRGKPGAPGFAGSQLRKGPRHPEPDHGPGPDPPSAADVRAHAAKENGSVSPGTRLSTISPNGSGGRSARVDRTRSCTTSVGPARTATQSGCSPPGASTATTRTRTSARALAAPATTTGWDSIGRAPITRTQTSSS